MFNLLLSKWKKFIKIVKRLSKNNVDEAKLKEVDKLLVQNKNRKLVEYDRPSLFRLVCEAYEEGKKSAHAIARYASRPLVRIKYWITKSPSHDTISDFFNELTNIIGNIFDLIVKRAKQIGLFKTYVPKLIDTTDIKTRFKSDPDAQWNRDASKNCWYWGYGGLIVIDSENNLPCAARLVRSKKVDAYESMEVTGKTIENVGADVVIGDSEFDMNVLINYAEKFNVLFVTPYNPRNTKEELPIKYRNEVTHNFNFSWLDEVYKERIEIEHSIGTVKENFGLEELYIKCYKKVNVQFFLTLCLRLINGIVTFQKGLNPRRVTMI